MKKSKSQAQRIHAKRRALQRYDLALNREQLDALVKRIQTGDNVTFVLKQSNRISHYELEIEGKKVRVVYDRERHNIVTFLPPIPPWDIQRDPVEW